MGRVRNIQVKCQLVFTAMLICKNIFRPREVFFFFFKVEWLQPGFSFKTCCAKDRAHVDGLNGVGKEFSAMRDYYRLCARVWCVLHEVEVILL